MYTAQDCTLCVLALQAAGFAIQWHPCGLTVPRNPLIMDKLVFRAQRPAAAVPMRLQDQPRI